jgi:hypothetical protein
MSVISPTVRRWYEENPDWAASPVLRRNRNFGTSKNVDIHGFDEFGWDERGFDRAGYSASEYLVDPSLDDLVYSLAFRIKGPANPAAPLSKTLPASGAVLEILCEAWPGATVHDRLTKALEDIDHANGGSVVITRTIDIFGGIAVDLSILPESPDDGRMSARCLKFKFDREVALRAQDPVKTTSFSVTVYNGDEFPDWDAVTDLRSKAEITEAAEGFISGFRGNRFYYAISVEDDELGGHVAATAVSDESTEDECRAASLVSGDYLFLEMASSPVEALQAVKDLERIRSHALREMLDRGMSFALEPDSSPSTLY